MTNAFHWLYTTGRTNESSRFIHPLGDDGFALGVLVVVHGAILEAAPSRPEDHWEGTLAVAWDENSDEETVLGAGWVQ